MDKRQTIAHLTQDRQEQMLLSLVCERMETAQKKNIPAFSAFLSGREQQLVRALLPEPEVFFCGGAEAAERKICCFLPDYLEKDFLISEDSPICAVRAEFGAQEVLSHRDFLGALMGAGLKRSCVGDIYVHDGVGELLLLREMLPYVLENVTSAGRVGLHFSEISLCSFAPPQAKLQSFRDTVPSLRLDCIVSAGFRISRGRAAEYITSGRVEADHFLCTKPDKLLTEGCTVSVRGLGKMRLSSVDGTTKKGRLGITVDRYV